VGQQDIHKPDRRTALLAAFDSMSDDAQIDSLAMLEAIALSSPRRVSTGLRLVSSSDDSFGLRKGASRGQ
jgi:hypothetical protein